MKMHNLGKSGLKVSELCLGTMTFGGKGNFSEIGEIEVSEAKILVNTAIDSGINFFDTADAYSSGRSEEILGKALGTKRKNSIICTKVYFSLGDEDLNKKGASRYHIIEGCHNSLKRLNTDYIDVYMLHTIDATTPLDESLKALDDLVRWGKVRYIGCSNYSAWQLMKALGISERLNLERFITFQGHYSVLAREMEYEHIPLCIDQGVGIMVWSPLSGGFLTGKYRKSDSLPKESRVSLINKTIFVPPFDLEKGFGLVDALDKIARKHNATIAQASINYLIDKPGISTIVLGVRNKKQLLDNLNSLKWKMDENEMEILDKISSPPIHYPYWHQQKHN